MLSLVTGIPQNSFQPFTVGAPKSHRAVELERRRLHISKCVKDLGVIAGICPQKLNELKININCKFGIDADAKYPDEVNLSMLYFFDFEKDFNVSVNDLINLDDQGIQDYYDKILSVFNLKGNLLDEGSRQAFRREFAWIKNNPERAANALRFTILHEMGHLVDPKNMQIPLPSKKKGRYFSFFMFSNHLWGNFLR